MPEEDFVEHDDADLPEPDFTQPDEMILPEYAEPETDHSKIIRDLSVLIHAQKTLIGSLLVLHKSIVGDYEHIEKLKDALRTLDEHH